MEIRSVQSTLSSGSLRLPVGSAAAHLKTLEEQDSASKKILRAVTKQFPDANIKPLEDGRRVFVSTEVRNKKHQLCFLMTEQGKTYLRRKIQIKIKTVPEPIEIWSQESFLVDRNNALALLNEYAGKMNTTKLTSTFAALMD